MFKNGFGLTADKPLPVGTKIVVKRFGKAENEDGQGALATVTSSCCEDGAMSYSIQFVLDQTYSRVRATDIVFSE
jgi:hypothetical protein